MSLLSKELNPTRPTCTPKNRLGAGRKHVLSNHIQNISWSRCPGTKYSLSIVLSMWIPGSYKAMRSPWSYRGVLGAVGSSGRLALTFHEGSSGCPVPAAPVRITTKSSSLGLTTDPRSCILLTTSGVPVLLWSPGSHSFQVSPFWQFSASAVTFLSAYSLKTDVLQDHLLVCLCIDLSIVYLLPESSTHPHSFHHP